MDGAGRRPDGFSDPSHVHSISSDKVARRPVEIEPPPTILKISVGSYPTGFVFTSAHLSALSAICSEPGSAINQ